MARFPSSPCMPQLSASVATEVCSGEGTAPLTTLTCVHSRSHTHTQAHFHVLIHPLSHTLMLTPTRSHSLTHIHSQADPSSPTSQSYTHAHTLGAHTHPVTLTHSHSHHTPSHTLTYSHTLTIATPLTLGKSLTLLYPFSLPSVGRLFPGSRRIYGAPVSSWGYVSVRYSLSSKSL